MYWRQLFYSGLAYLQALGDPTKARAYDLHTREQWQGDNLVLIKAWFWDEKDNYHEVPLRFIQRGRDGLYEIRREYWKEKQR